ncbi:RCC1 and BTB domain-containing protein 1-like [Penaeus indicus]|uniref:RCC1 and BTB domain-containing protein 1-like n=1 Tax=Penaeus indicus TaxID=29960 RepID=UPI00300CAF04
MKPNASFSLNTFIRYRPEWPLLLRAEDGYSYSLSMVTIAAARPVVGVTTHIGRGATILTFQAPTLTARLKFSLGQSLRVDATTATPLTLPHIARVGWLQAPRSTFGLYPTSLTPGWRPLGRGEIVCGYSHTLALSDEGSLWAWGANGYGQLGTGNKANQCAPVRVAQDIGRIVDIASTHYCHLSAAMTQNSKVYLWGHCKGQSVVGPLETGFSSLHEVFALWASPSVTYEPLNVTSFTRSSLAQAMALALDDEETADVVFVVDDRRIRAHRAVLKIRCQYFRNMFQEHWKENSLEEVEVKDYSFVVFRAFLQYIYTDTVNVSPEDAIGLLDLANAYCEEALKRHCERIIRHGITTENAAMLYAVAIKYEATELEEFCFRFALNHMTEVAQTEAFMALDELTVKNFIQRAAQHGAFKY